MRVVEIIPSKTWLNIKTGQKASIYGSIPYYGENDKADWIIRISGYTWKLDNGTIGLGRIPTKTYEEAKEVMDKINARHEERAKLLNL